MKMTAINQTNQNQSFGAILKNSHALVELVGKLPVVERDEFYKILKSPETIKKIREIKIDDMEPVMKVGYVEGDAVFKNTFLMKISHNGINESVTFFLERNNPQYFVDNLIYSMKNASGKIQDSFKYINRKLTPIIDKINNSKVDLMSQDLALEKL